MVIKRENYGEYLKAVQGIPLETINNSVANWRLRNTGKKINWEEVSHCDYTADELKLLVKGIKCGAK